VLTAKQRSDDKNKEKGFDDRFHGAFFDPKNKLILLMLDCKRYLSFCLLSLSGIIVLSFVAVYPSVNAMCRQVPGVWYRNRKNQ
jgi:hypothetical protein